MTGAALFWSADTKLNHGSGAQNSRLKTSLD